MFPVAFVSFSAASQVMDATLERKYEDSNPRFVAGQGLTATIPFTCYTLALLELFVKRYIKTASGTGEFIGWKSALRTTGEK